jgi:hypothetical protein
MAVTVSLYNHTASLFLSGTINNTDSFRVILLSAGTFDATNTTLTQAATGYTELSSANGYTTGGLLLTNVVTPTVTTNDAKFDADDAIWSATGSGIVASKAILYDDTIVSNPPLIFIDFGVTETAPASTDFKIVWPSAGILLLTVA